MTVDTQLTAYKRSTTVFDPLTDKKILKNYPEPQHATIAASAINHARSIKSTVEGLMTSLDFEETDINLYKSELHKKFAFSILVILLFLISAPLGAIIRKGGIGMPLVISVVLFVLFYAVNLTGEKMGKEGIVPVWVGSWMSSMLLFPIGVIITYRASIDKSFQGTNPLKNWFVSMWQKLKLRKSSSTIEVPQGQSSGSKVETSAVTESKTDDSIS
jgi:lipopolysaccharide export system permease protein